MVNVRVLLCALAAQTALALHPVDHSVHEAHGIASHGEPGQESSAKPIRQTTYPSVMLHRESNEKILKHIDIDRMNETMWTLTYFNNRYYKSNSGVQASDWIFEKIKRYSGTFKIQRIRHSWPQRSIDVQISEGNGAKRQDKRVIVVGAHMDSVNRSDVNGEASGADDNASGVAVLLEALYLLLRDQKTKHFTNQVHFHFYSGEEAGLLGSKEIFQQYAKDGVDVVAVLNQDMTGRGDTDPRMFTMITDYVYKPLNNFIIEVIKSYTKFGIKEWPCRYACSDHGSATRNGFPAAFVSHGEIAETATDYIHTTNDTLEHINYDQMSEHVKLVLGFVLELGFADFAAAPVATQSETQTETHSKAPPKTQTGTQTEEPYDTTTETQTEAQTETQPSTKTGTKATGTPAPKTTANTDDF